MFSECVSRMSTASLFWYRIPERGAPLEKSARHPVLLYWGFRPQRLSLFSVWVSGISSHNFSRKCCGGGSAPSPVPSSCFGGIIIPTSSLGLIVITQVLFLPLCSKVMCSLTLFGKFRQFSTLQPGGHPLQKSAPGSAKWVRLARPASTAFRKNSFSACGNLAFRFVAGQFYLISLVYLV